LLVDTDNLFDVVIRAIFVKSLDVFELTIEILLLHKDALLLAEVLDRLAESGFNRVFSIAKSGNQPIICEAELLVSKL
jgi:hypothetical protein